MAIPFEREQQWQALAEEGARFDVLIVGGGATGLGIALDAALRGYRTALCERFDFGHGTSSRSTKLIHGGVRYLQQGNFRLVRDALRERALLLRNAHAVAHPLSLVIPLYYRWEKPYYRCGLEIYERLAGRQSIGRPRTLSADETLARLPTLRTSGLRGGVEFVDGAFDDARLVVALAQTAAAHGAVCVNHARVRELPLCQGKISGALVEDVETGRTVHVAARAVVNAAGPHSDAVRRLAEPQAEAWLAPSQGVHLVVDRKFLPGNAALLVPRTRDGRVVFITPYRGHVLIGTTDTSVAQVDPEPVARPEELDLLLATAADYLAERPQAADVRSLFAGLRPLVRRGESAQTSRLGRDHQIRISPNGLINVLGGKWTTYRKMAEDCVDALGDVTGLGRGSCRTQACLLNFDALQSSLTHATDPSGWSRPVIDEARPLVAGAPWTRNDVEVAARDEMARTVDDVLVRRLPTLTVDVRAALEAAPLVAGILAELLGREAAWRDQQAAQFRNLANIYLPRE